MMSEQKPQCLFTCDACGTQAAGFYANLRWHKPAEWYQRSDRDGAQVACSRECIDVVAQGSGKTGCVLPI
jgi:hypothetical protein